MSELFDLTIAEAAERIQSGEISAVDLANSLLHLTDKLDPELHAWVTIDREDGLGAAHERDQQVAAGNILGSLHGVPVGSKDIDYTAGMKTSACSKVLSDFVPASVARLKEAGAIVLGQAVTTEFACRNSNRRTN